MKMSVKELMDTVDTIKTLIEDDGANFTEAEITDDSIIINGKDGDAITFMPSTIPEDLMEAYPAPAVQAPVCDTPIENMPFVGFMPYEAMLSSTLAEMNNGSLEVPNGLKRAINLEDDHNVNLVNDILNIEREAAQRKFEIDMQAKAAIYNTLASYNTLAGFHRIYDSGLVEMCRLVDMKKDKCNK
jgi:hypothetical protein